MKKIISIILILVMCLAVFASCVNPADDTESKEKLESARQYLNAMYRDSAEETGADYKMVNTLKVGDDTFTVVWTTDTEAVKVIDGEGTSTIDVDEKSAETVTYKLTGTIKDANGNTITVEYTHKVPKFIESGWADWVKACEAKDPDKSITVTAYVIGVVGSGSSMGSIWLQDASGKGYYAYNPALEESVKASREALNAEFPIGAEVTVSGTVTVYNGCYEYNKGCTVVKTGKTAEENGVTLGYTDVTAAFAAASDNKDGAKLNEYQNARVVLKGVTLDAVDGSYYYFTVDGKKFNLYKNTYMLDNDGLNALLAKWEVGSKANIKGVVNVYSNSFQIYPDSLDSIEIINEDLTDAQRVERAKAALALSATLYKKDFTLPSEGAQGTTLVWSVKEATPALTIANNAATVAPQEAETEVVIVATIKYGEATDTKEFTIKIDKKGEPTQEEILAAAFALETGATLEGGPHTLTGVITKINTAYSAEYKNITVTITIADKEIQCFRMKGEGADALKENDTIKVTGTIKNYNGIVEFDAGCTFVIPGEGPSEAELQIVEDAFALETGATLEGGPHTLTGVITKINTAYSAEYKNITVTITIADKEIQCFRMKGEGADALKENDTITVTGTIKNYNGTVEFDAGCTFVLAEAGESGGEGGEGGEGGGEQPQDFDPTGKTEAEILAAAFALESGKSFAAPCTLEGTIETAGTYSTQYKNIDVNITVGDKTLKCFRIACTQAEAEALKVGAVIAVTGTITNYNGTIEFAQGCTFVLVTAAPEGDEGGEGGEGGGEQPQDFDPTGKTEAEILTAAFALETGKSFAAPCTLEGTIATAGTYSTQFNNIDVNITVGDKTLKCFRIACTQAEAEALKVGAVIAVTGTITNYNGTIEFAQGCTFVLVTAAPEGGEGDEGGESENTITLSYSGAGTQNMTGENDAALLGHNDGKISVVGSKNDNSNLPGLNKDGSIRMYCNTGSANGNSIVITAAPGIAISKISLTVGAGKNSTQKFAVNGTEKTVAQTGDTFVIDNPGNTITIQNVSNGASAIQVWFTSIVITYETVPQ